MATKEEILREASLLIGSTNTTEVNVPLHGLAMCCAEAMAFYKLLKFTTPKTLEVGSSLSFKVSDWVMAKVPSLPTNKCDRLTLPSVV